MRKLPPETRAEQQADGAAGPPPQNQRQPKRHSKSWGKTIQEQRNELGALSDHNPSLQQLVPELIPNAYRRAVKTAALGTGKAAAEFPRERPFSISQILADAIER